MSTGPASSKPERHLPKSTEPFLLLLQPGSTVGLLQCQMPETKPFTAYTKTQVKSINSEKVRIDVVANRRGTNS